jgi:dihydroorotase
MNLCFTEDKVLNFDQQYKVYPPLRSETDRQALIQGVLDGTISAIVSDHIPLEIESKDVEFDEAAFGARGLEGMFAALQTFAPEVPLETLVQALTSGPASVIGVPAAEIAEGASAELTLFVPGKEWTFAQEHIPYGYANTPLLGMRLNSSVVGVVVG